MVMQAGEYERAQGKELEQFFTSTAGKFTTPVGQAWEAEIIRRRGGSKQGGEDGGN
jgi:putative hydrolase of HD superfamily